MHGLQEASPCKPGESLSEKTLYSIGKFLFLSMNGDKNLRDFNQIESRNFTVFILLSKVLRLTE